MTRYTCKLCGATMDRRRAREHVEAHVRKWRQAQTEGVRKIFPLHHAPPPQDAA